MKNDPAKRILFCGYAPVHFVCFRPIYQRLRNVPGLEFRFSGGLRAPGSDGESLSDAQALYRPFHLPRESVLSQEEMRRQDFDLVICGFVSGAFPRSDKMRVHLFHGISFRNMAVRQDILIYDRLFNVGPYQLKLFEELRLVRKGDPRMVPIGFPKLDPLVDGSLDRKAILRRLGLSGKRPVVIYAPTGQRFNSLEIMGEEVLRRLRKADRYDILIKIHDHPRDRSVDWADRLHGLEDEHTKVLRDYDIVPYLFVSDLLLTDASSVSNEYMLLDRPMVFIDVPQMLAAVRDKGLAVDEDWGRRGGITARWPDEVVAAVSWGLKHPKHGSLERRRMVKELFFDPGHATERAAAWILDRCAIHDETRDPARSSQPEAALV